MLCYHTNTATKTEVWRPYSMRTWSAGWKLLGEMCTGYCCRQLVWKQLLLLLHLFRSLFSRTTCVSRHQKGKPFSILLEQEMMGWQWHQLDHIQGSVCNGSISKKSLFFRKRLCVLQVLLLDFTNMIWQLSICLLIFTPLESSLRVLSNCVFLKFLV